MIERLWLQIRSMGLFFFMPFIGYFVLVPFCITMLNLSVEDVNERYFTVERICYQFVPVFSMVWICMFHKEYVEGEGREVLVLGKGICALTFLFWLMNLPCFGIFYLLPDAAAFDVGDLFGVMAIVSFILCGLVFFLNFTVNSISLSALVAMFYVMLSNVDLTNFMALNSMETVERQQIEGYFYSALKSGGIHSDLAFNYIVAGVLFWLFGLLRARRM